MSRQRRRQVVVLGAGRVGGLIAADLAADRDLAVTAVDHSLPALRALASRAPVRTRRADLGSRRAVGRAVAGAEVVVGAVPGALGRAALEASIEAGCPLVDISFMPEDPLELDGRARERGVPVVVDCGVAPGLSNWLVGHAGSRLEELDLVEILVGGLPFRRVWPFEYRAVFSPADVIEEYTRPCRMREHGREVVVPALSGVEPVELSEVGTLEAFYTDGLRTLLHTVPAPTMREKTLRYPGHAEKMRLLRDAGFFGREPLELDGVRVAPRAVAEALLGRAWTADEDEEEFTVLRVLVEGRRRGRRRRLIWDLFDRTDAETGVTSMARTTGFPCAIVARMLASGAWSEPGVHPPERLGREPALTERLLDELERRGVGVQGREERPGAAPAS